MGIEDYRKIKGEGDAGSYESKGVRFGGVVELRV